MKGLVWSFLLLCFLLPIAKALIGVLFRKLVEVIDTYGLIVVTLYLVFLPFKLLNSLQMFLQKPWRYFQRYNRAPDKIKKALRVLNVIGMVPLYIVLTPLRFVNAVAYNLVLRFLAELWSYICEVFSPCDTHEGYGSFWKWILMLPYRILKYPVYHGMITILEGLIFTVADTFYPTVTLYHGTTSEAAEAILRCPTRNRTMKFICGWTDGVWNVGDGNYAGDGIYFAPHSDTALHYASSKRDPVLILCRVSLGRILPMSLAPDEVYRSAGFSNAHKVTAYGLKNGYTSVEWWRHDCSWWEYCLLDWQNKYNESWRIRPISVIHLKTRFFMRVDGGSRHWLFDKLVLNDLAATLSGKY